MPQYQNGSFMVSFLINLQYKLLLFLDSAYTERYMGMPGPEENWEGYQMADLTK